MTFAPAVYEHAAAFLGLSPWEVSRDGTLLAEAHAAAYRRYGHAPVVVGIDIYNVEAEAYGAAVERPDGDLPPALERRLCEHLDGVLALPLLDPERDGRIPMVLEAAEAVRTRHPGADVRVPLSGPFSVAAALLGLEPLLFALIADPELAARALEHLARGQAAIARAAARRDLPVILFDSAASPPLLSPALYREVVLPSLRAVMAEAASARGAAAGCVVGGNTVPILPALMETGPSYVICPVETDRAAFIAAMGAHPDVTVRINTPPELYVDAPWERVEAELTAAAALARGRPRTVVGTGVLPYETDPERVLRAARFVRSID